MYVYDVVFLCSERLLLILRGRGGAVPLAVGVVLGLRQHWALWIISCLGYFWGLWQRGPRHMALCLPWTQPAFHCSLPRDLWLSDECEWHRDSLVHFTEERLLADQQPPRGTWIPCFPVSWAWAPLLWCGFLDAVYLRKRMLPDELEDAACLWVTCHFLLVTCTVGLAYISSAILSFHDVVYLQKRSDQTCCGNMWL